MTEEIAAKLKALGIDPGRWKPGVPGVEINASALFGPQVEALEKIKAILEAELTKDQARLATAHAALAKAKFGGGA